MYICIISLTCFAATDVSAAPTVNEILESAAKATLENARVNGTGLELTSSQSVTYVTDYYSPVSAEGNAIVSTMSNMRAQAELYYSYNDGYGSKTQSCSTGIFADSQYGLKSLVTSLKQKSKEVSCISKGTSFAVSARLKAGEYWCVDSAGDSKGISKILKKGTATCSSGSKIPAKPVTKTSGVISTVYPTATGFDYKYSLTGNMSSQFDMSIVVKSGMTYLQATKAIDEEVAYKNRGLYVGRYIEIPSGSYIDQYASLKVDVQKFIARILNPSISSVSLLRTNVDTSSVYQINVPYEYLGNTGYYSSTNGTAQILVTVKNGLITSITSNSLISSANQTKVVYSLKSKFVPNNLNALLQGKTVSCLNYFDEDEYCATIDMGNYKEISTEKGTAAAIQSYLSNMRAQAELYYSNFGNYGSNARTCSEGIFGSKEVGGLSELVASTKKYSPTFTYCAANGLEWVVSAALPTGGYFCVDSTGNAKSMKVKSEYADMSCK